MSRHPAVSVRQLKHHHHLRLHPMALALALTLGSPPLVLAAVAAGDATSSEAQLPEISVKASNASEPTTEKSSAYTIRKTSSATKLDLSLRETPQSVSVVTRAKMDDFRQNSVNDVLANTTGVTVEKIETDRTYYTARGFDITNFQFDGIGVPFTSGNVGGDMDTAVYDRVDIVRGATSLMSATGNPSATVNFVRKRPTYDFRAATGLTLGSWNTRRIDADVSGALNSAGTVAGRFVVANETGDSYLDRYAPDKTVFHGVIEANLSDSTLLTVGHTQQKNKPKGGMWGALPLYYTDGSPTNYPVSTSTSANWSYWNTQEDRTFVELNQQLNGGWQAKASLGYNKVGYDSKLFYVYGTPDRTTGAGLYSYPSQYDSENKQTVIDVSASGKFFLADREHDLTIGANWSKSTMDDVSHYGQGIGTPLPDLNNWTGNYPQPTFDAGIDGSSYVDKRKSVYAAARFNLADDLKLITGATITRAESSGQSYGVGHRTSASDTTPYLGVVLDLSKNLSAYASYSAIFNPQTQTGIKGNPLDPVKGKSVELGLKSEFFDRKLNASAAVFKTKQSNAAEQAGYVGAKAYYTGIDAESQGFELDLSGELAEGLQASVGYTQLSISGSDGNAARTYVPRKLLRVSTTYRLPQLAQMKVGASVNWQDDTQRDQGGGIVTRQASYALLNLMARYDITKQLSISANLNNVTDKKYLTSLYWGQGFYGAPRNASVALHWKY